MPVASGGVHDARDYGAICDGRSHVGADGREADWRGIQEALNAAQAVVAVELIWWGYLTAPVLAAA